MIRNELEELIFEYGILEKAFDTIRLVDPMNNRVLDLAKMSATDTQLQCFQIWNKDAACNNCISLRAYQDNKTYVKLEYSADELYIVIAIPLKLPGRTVVLEIMKLATESFIVDPLNPNIYADAQQLIDKMNNLALTDSLTGLYNRRYINEKLPYEISRAAMSGVNLSIIMIDIDFFKNINDTYGHLVGDRILKKLAKKFSKGLSRERDWVARFGGEEFLVCLPGAGMERATEIAEVIRKKVEATVFEYENVKYQITASFGVCTATPEMNVTMEELIERADIKLYEAKHKGRNRVEG